MGWWNDNAARIDGSGRLTLGQTADDGQGNATYPYAKDDIWWTIPLVGSGIVAAVATTGNWVPLGQTNTGVSVAGARAQNATYGVGSEYILLSCASANSYIKVPISAIFRSAGATNPNVGKGMLLKGITVAYEPITSALTTGLTVQAWTRKLSSGVAEDGTQYGGTVSYQSPLGTVVTGLQLVTTTGQYAAEAIFAAPSWISTADTDLYAELAVGLGATPYNLRIYRIGVRAAFAPL